MTQYNNLDVKLPNLQLKKMKIRITNGTEVVLNLSSNATGKSNVDSNFLLLLTDIQVWGFVNLLPIIDQLM